MAFMIGFAADQSPGSAESTCIDPQQLATPRKSVVQVAFPGRSTALAYYNDCFDLRRGDIVYVDGMLEGLRGCVVEVNYNFKIKLSDYKRVIAVADTDVQGQFYIAGSHFVTFESEALPISKVSTWYMPPSMEGDEYVSGNDGTAFRLDGFDGFKVSKEIAERGRDYYMGNKVVYICIDGNKGYAIVEGSRPYEVEFNYCNGEISGLVCSCFCCYNCKHEVATMLQLSETLKLIKKNYSDMFEETGYFAAICKSALVAFAVDGKETGGFVL